MKNAVIMLALVLSSLLTFASKGEKKTITIKTQIYCSHCQQCESCGKNINDHIRESNKGISKVSVDEKANTITVTYDTDKTNPESIRTAINKAGYDADDQKASADAVKALDGCCKKKG